MVRRSPRLKEGVYNLINRQGDLIYNNHQIIADVKRTMCNAGVWSEGLQETHKKYFYNTNKRWQYLNYLNKKMAHEYYEN